MFDDTPLLVVETSKTLAAVCERFSKAKVLAVDTESDSMHHYQEKVCLLQFTDAEGDVIVDPLAVDDLSPLGEILADPKIEKIFHGADYDIVCLKRDFNFHPAPIFDTLIAAQFLGLPRLGLADLIKRSFGWEIDKALQRHDWSQRPLLQDHLDYARGDTHFLAALREILLRDLKRAKRIAHVEEECALLVKKAWQGRTFDADGWVRIKGSRELDETEQRILRQLWIYRDAAARDLDRPAFKVLGDSLMLDIAREQPESEAQLDRRFSKMHGMRRRHGRHIVDAVHAGLDDATKLVTRAPKKRASEEKEDEGPARLHGRAADVATEALKTWRNKLVDTDRRHSPYSVASNGDLRAIARARPFTLDELAAVPGIRAWQVRDHGKAILKVLDKAVPEGEPLPEGEGNGSSGRRRRR